MNYVGNQGPSPDLCPPVPAVGRPIPVPQCPQPTEEHGGIEGAKVKVPTPCEALAALRPVQLIGGEQTLFAVTADGKVRRCIFCVTLTSKLRDSCG